jgi:peptidoglycan-N-acetylglucosamine deacetylase
MINAITVDLEDWYHICGTECSSSHSEWQKYSSRLEKSVDKILKLLCKSNTKATFFVVGLIAEKYPRLVKRIASEGHEIATHGFYHRRIFDMSPEEFENDLLKSIYVIEKASGKKVHGYRAPEWSLKKDNAWALDILKKHGFVYDASAVPLSHLSGKSFGIFPSDITTAYGSIKEFPLNTFRVFWERVPFSGGLPMRITPYFYILGYTKKLNRAGHPVMFYIHPWEFETNRVKIDLPFNRKFMHYCNLKSTPLKLEMLLKHLRFSTVEHVLQMQKSDFSKCGHNNSHIYGHMDAAYFKSFFFTYALLFGIFSIFAISIIINTYLGLLILLIFSTIWYWPWGLLFKFTQMLNSKKRSI